MRRILFESTASYERQVLVRFVEKVNDSVIIANQDTAVSAGMVLIAGGEFAVFTGAHTNDGGEGPTMLDTVTGMNLFA